MGLFWLDVGQLTWNLRTSAPEYTNMNQTSTKSPIAAATLEIISARLAKLSTVKMSPDEKPNTLVSTLCSNVSLKKTLFCKNTCAAMESNWDSK
jgi:hypothetical protein